MANLFFVLALAGFFSLLFNWGFRNLPREQWQFIVSFPLRKDSHGHWTGLNLTYYGFFNANAYSVGVILVFVLMGSLGLPLKATLLLTLVLLAVCAPASRWIASYVENRRYTFTVGGASFLGMVIAPWTIVSANAMTRHWLDLEIPVIPSLAALSIGYAFGEGTGRLACISFGCCYGKPLTECPSIVQRLFSDFSFVFSGKTKKIAYESSLDGQRVIPVQGATCILFVAAGLVGLVLFLNGLFTSALLFVVVSTQLWRTFSEILRADHRGGGHISIYQWMSLGAVFYSLGLPPLLPNPPAIVPDIVSGILSIWTPSMILFIQLLWVSVFLYTGRSMVTRSSISFHVLEDRI